ncbi:hypothetical protein PG996_002996 [Apiospora saccharicola]|uniref:ZZ-type domain-containing protein n=1 Tax=Apiospora saccharicola TaxID=335842 RepID=A0ABR1VZZ7_9PEZI
MASASDFRYTPLEDPENCLRLLQLLPGEHNDDDLHATLTPFQRDAAPEYRPVSYTWGDEEPSSQLLIQNHGQQEWVKFPIRPNLEALLRQVRSSLGAQYIWVDAICINYEKGHQVRTMDRIYRDKHVFVWLGPLSEDSSQAMDLIDNFWGQCDSASWSPGSSEAYKAICNFTISSRVPRASWKSIFNLISRLWFSRRWVVQEFVLSGQKDFWVGSRHQDFHPLICLALFLKESVFHISDGETKTDVCFVEPGHGHNLPSPDIDPIDRLERLWSAYLTTQTEDATGRSLEHLLDKFSGFVSSDPRDGIYAFISMASDKELSDWLPDYSDRNPVEIFYKNVTLHIIWHSESLDIMARSAYQAIDFTPILREDCQWGDRQGNAHSQPHIHLLHGYNIQSLTTFGQPLKRLKPGQEGWIGRRECDGCDKPIVGAGLKCIDCADFDYCHACARTSDVTHDPDHRFRYHNGAVYFAWGLPTATILPCRDSSHDCHGLNEPRGLTASPFGGIIVDRIKKEGYPAQPHMVRMPDVGFSLSLPGDNLTKGSELPGMQDYFDADGTPDDRILRTMIGNRRVSGGVVCHVTDSWTAIARQRFFSRIVGRETDLRSHETAADDEHAETIREAMESVNFMHSNQRKFVVTERSLGFVPSGASCGDSIAILNGCSVPLVIRRYRTNRKLGML